MALFEHKFPQLAALYALSEAIVVKKYFKIHFGDSLFSPGQNSFLPN